MNHATRFARLVLLLALVGALALAGCGGGDGAAPVEMPPDPPPSTPYEMASAAIAAAETAEAAQAAYDAVKDDVTATQGESLQMKVNDRIAALEMMARAAEQKMALMTAAGMIDMSDLSTQEAIAAARMAIAALRGALNAADDVTNADKAMYMTQLTNAENAVDMAQGGIDTATRRTNQMTALTSASGTLQTALAALSGQTPTQAQLNAANMALTALNTAIENAADLTGAEKAPYQREAGNAAAPISMAQTAFDDATDKQAEKDMETAAETGKALYAALAGPTAAGTALDNIVAFAETTGLQPTGLVINAAENAGTFTDGTDPDGSAGVTLEAGDSAGALGSWNGMDYMHTNTGTKVVNAARVYTNKGPGKTVSLADAEIDVHTDATAGDDIKGYYTVDESADVAKIMGSAFTHSGTQNHAYDPTTKVAFTARGTFDGAPGEYRCTGTCASTNDGKGSPSVLAGTWHFKPDSGAMVHQPDDHYLYYGWWVSKDKDGVPTAASAFAGRFGTDPDDSTDGLDNGWTGNYTAGTTLSGSATYAGHAAGKFAMDNPLDGTGNGGHFTAEASLSAKFSGTTGVGITGTIDNFRLNDGSEDAGWSVSLHRADWGTDGAFATPETDDTDTPNVDETMGTTWSVDGNSAGRSGTWSGQMYDEMPGPAPDGDGSTIPTTVTGTFYSKFSTIGQLVGGFGADKQ